MLLLARPGKAGLSLTLYQPFMAGPPFMKPQGHAAGSVCGLARDTHRVDANGVGKDVCFRCEARADHGAMDFSNRRRACGIVELWRVARGESPRASDAFVVFDSDEDALKENSKSSRRNWRDRFTRARTARSRNGGAFAWQTIKASALSLKNFEKGSTEDSEFLKNI